MFSLADATLVKSWKGTLILVFFRMTFSSPGLLAAVLGFSEGCGLSLRSSSTKFAWVTFTISTK